MNMYTMEVCDITALFVIFLDTSKHQHLLRPIGQLLESGRMGGGAHHGATFIEKELGSWNEAVAQQLPIQLQ